MSYLAETFLTKEEKEKVSQAVEEVESTTSAEIVPLIVSSSYTYPRAEIVGCLTISLTVALGVSLALQLTDMWSYLAFFAVAFVLSFLLIKYMPGLKRLFITENEMEEEVKEGAEKSFFAYDLQDTRDRTGILIYISVYEKKVFVLADKGINDKVDQKVWEEIVDMIITGIHERRSGDAISQAVRRCGDLVRDKFPQRPDDKNELSNLIVEGKSD